jgi:flagellin-like hook-associated protein FlgL
MNITMSGATRASLLALQTVSDQIDGVQRRMTTGKRVNSVFDDPTAYFLSSSLSARASSLNQLVDNVSSVSKAVDAANNGIKAITTLLTSAQTAANAAMQSANTLVKVTGTNATALTSSTVIGSTSGSSSRFKTGDTVTVNDGTTTGTYTAANGDTVQSLLNAINGTANLKVTASLNSNGQIVLAATSTNNVTIGGTLTGSGTLSGVVGLSAGTTTFTANALRTSLAAQFDALRTQIDSAAADAGYSGLNLLSGGNKTVALNESGSASVTLSGATVSSNSLGLAASTNNFQIDSDITTALANITSALSSLQAQTAALGNNQAIVDARTQFNKSMATLLQSGSDDLVKSNGSEDSALLLALQTRQQLAASAISIATNGDKIALRLLGYN